MARIPYADIRNPETEPLVRQIVKERGSLLHLYQMLLHSPPVAAGWLRCLSAIRQECALPGALRELAIMRVALLTGATYEAEQHAPIARREGIAQAQLEALAEWDGSDAFDERERAVLAYVDAMTNTVRVPDDVFARIRRAFDERVIVELTATVAAYNMVSRVLEALQVHSDDPRP